MESKARSGRAPTRPPARRRRSRRIGEEPYQSLASVAAVLGSPRVRALIPIHSRPVVLDAVQNALDRYRTKLGPSDPPPSVDEIAASAGEALEELALPRLRPVINATGVLLHTGLGRAVLSKRVTARLAKLDRCTNLQIDLTTGQRGRREGMLEYLLGKLTGAQAAVVVNNNAAATLLTLRTLCAGREVLVSRGQLIEIGGSFRLGECVRESGAILVEVGATNRTHIQDYEAALTENTGAILRVNPSNFRVIGFTREVGIVELAALKARRPVLLIDDLGCGALVDMTAFGLAREPTVRESIDSGADVVLFSGDKLIGGPQAGIIVGRKEPIEKIRKHPLTRMLRICKLTALALEESLRLFLEPETLVSNHPTLSMATTPVATLRDRARRICRMIGGAPGRLVARSIESESAVGGGTMPGLSIESRAVALRSSTITPEELLGLLRRSDPPVIARIVEGEVVIDTRTLLPGEERLVQAALRRIHEPGGRLRAHAAGSGP